MIKSKLLVFSLAFLLSGYSFAALCYNQKNSVPLTSAACSNTATSLGQYTNDGSTCVWNNTTKKCYFSPGNCNPPGGSWYYETHTANGGEIISACSY